MKLLTGAQAINSPFDCERWARSTPTATPGDPGKGVHDRYSVVLIVPPGQSSDDLFDRAVKELLQYRVFPANRMRCCVCTLNQEVTEGAVIVQRVLIGLLAIEMAVRVVEVFHRETDERRSGFTYVTLEGHIECGTATFFLRKSPGGDVSFDIESWSQPGNWRAALARPIARSIQARFTAEALEDFRARLSSPKEITR